MTGMLAKCVCGALEGELHVPGCDFERCPGCGGQLFSCDCEDPVERVPFFHFPNICHRCAKVYPGIFMVPDREWRRVVPRGHWRDVICWDCYEFMRSKMKVDGVSKEVAFDLLSHRCGY
jgi:hypothetical protein